MTSPSHSGDARSARGCWRRSSAGFTLIELMIVVAIIAIIAATTMPGLLRTRMSANEGSAIASLRAVNAAQAAFSSTCARNGFAQSLEDLAQAPPGAAQPYISPDLSINGGLKSGYRFVVSADVGAVPVTLAADTCNSAAADAVSSYFAEAHPASVGSTGRRSFATDRRGTIFARDDGATITSGMAGASPLP